MFFSTAQAQDATTNVAQMSPVASGVFPMVLILVVMYILIIRPNQKKLKDHNEMIKALRRGDKVVTAGGVIGVINKIEDDNIVVVEVSENVKIRVIRETISSIVNKTPVANDNKKDEKTGDKSKNK